MQQSKTVNNHLSWKFWKTLQVLTNQLTEEAEIGVSKTQWASETLGVAQELDISTARLTHSPSLFKTPSWMLQHQVIYG